LDVERNRVKFTWTNRNQKAKRGSTTPHAANRTRKRRAPEREGRQGKRQEEKRSEEESKKERKERKERKKY
jgi:hypothetical protein